MNRLSQGGQFALGVFMLALFALSAVAQDTLTLGGTQCSSGAPGTVVHVPVWIRDASGTPLGVDQLVGSRIQAFSFNVTPAPSNAIATDIGGLTVTTSPAGIAVAAGTPVFVSSPRTTTTFGYVVTYDETTQLLPFTLNGAPPGNLVADAAVTLSGGAVPGTTIALAVDPSATVTLLSNEAGTVTESVGSNLVVTSGCINVIAPAAPTLSGWAMLILALLIAAAAVYAVR